MTRGRRFYKMTGSGNDFVFVNAGDGDTSALEEPATIRRLCARGTGIGADGLVVLERRDRRSVAIRYYNSDGSAASLCGNATLCTASLATQLGLVGADGFVIETGAGGVAARLEGGDPVFDFPLVNDVAPVFDPIPAAPGELRLGYATAGVPHVVILVDDVDAHDVLARGRAVRFDTALPAGANVNFVARGAGGHWRIRTYERGVEGETLACGTGCISTGIMLRVWGESSGDAVLETRSGRALTVRPSPIDGGWIGSLSGEGRLVYRGELVDV